MSCLSGQLLPLLVIHVIHVQRRGRWMSFHFYLYLCVYDFIYVLQLEKVPHLTVVRYISNK